MKNCNKCNNPKNLKNGKIFLWGPHTQARGVRGARVGVAVAPVVDYKDCVRSLYLPYKKQSTVWLVDSSPSAAPLFYGTLDRALEVTQGACCISALFPAILEMVL